MSRARTSAGISCRRRTSGRSSQDHPRDPRRVRVLRPGVVAHDPEQDRSGWREGRVRSEQRRVYGDDRRGRGAEDRGERPPAPHARPGCAGEEPEEQPRHDVARVPRHVELVAEPSTQDDAGEDGRPEEPPCRGEDAGHCARNVIHRHPATRSSGGPSASPASMRALKARPRGPAATQTPPRSPGARSPAVGSTEGANALRVRLFGYAAPSRVSGAPRARSYAVKALAPKLVPRLWEQNGFAPKGWGEEPK